MKGMGWGIKAWIGAASGMVIAMAATAYIHPLVFFAYMALMLGVLMPLLYHLDARDRKAGGKGIFWIRE